MRSQEPTSALTDADNAIPEILVGEGGSWSVPAKQSGSEDAVKIEENPALRFLASLLDHDLPVNHAIFDSCDVVVVKKSP